MSNRPDPGAKAVVFAIFIPTFETPTVSARPDNFSVHFVVTVLAFKTVAVGPQEDALTLNVDTCTMIRKPRRGTGES